MNKKTLLPILGGVLVLAVFASRIVLRSMRNKDRTAPTKTIALAANIEGLEGQTIKKGEAKTIHIAVQGLRCSDLKITAAGLNLRKMNFEDCTCEISSDKVGDGFIMVRGGGKTLVDTFPVTVLE